MRRLALALTLLVGPAALAQEQPAAHVQPPPFFGTVPEAEAARLAEQGVEIERDRPAAHLLAEHRRMDRALAAIGPQRAGVVDAYVVVAALDSDPVFSREAREAGRVLARRYGAEGRQIVLAGPDGRGGAALPMGSPRHLATALARVAEQMDRREDVLVLYTTSHGAPIGVVYNDGDQGFGMVGPARLWAMLSQLGIDNRLLMVGACYAGGFVPMLQSDATAIVTAAAADKPSFGCQADNDWTFFGDALLNRALRKPQPFARAVAEAQGLIAGWEREGRLDPSGPQVQIGAGATRWLAALEARLPVASQPVGRPATDVLTEAPSPRP
jgi:hypothetical protein